MEVWLTRYMSLLVAPIVRCCQSRFGIEYLGLDGGDPTQPFKPQQKHVICPVTPPGENLNFLIKEGPQNLCLTLKMDGFPIVSCPREVFMGVRNVQTLINQVVGHQNLSPSFPLLPVTPQSSHSFPGT